MAQANITLVQSLYAAFGRGDIAVIAKAVTPEATWEIVGRGSDFPTLGRRQGPAGVTDFFQVVEQNLSFSEFSPKEFYAVEDKVFVLGHYATTVKKTGKRFASDWVHIFTIHGGKVVRFVEFTDTASAAAAYRG
ncbi:MAG TPA: nuclear transport factor 2 family protein [Xanthobacteraceae bacterium]|nr:nuclear transport factor 2 family protein [Xanthobacteraceae bacterium]